jgi:ribonucleoside-diphosphate reductase alpha chain
MDVGAWVWRYFDEVSGISFLPHSEHSYRQAPYQECTKEEYEAAVKSFPTIQWNMLSLYELEDTTTGTQDLACVAGSCEIVDITK